MSTSRIETLRATRNRSLSDAQLLLLAGISTKESKEKYENLIQEADEAESDIRSLERLDQLMKSDEFPVSESFETRVENRSFDESPELRKAKLDKAYRSLLRYGYSPERGEQRDVTISNDGTATIPQEFEAAWTSALKAYGPIATLVKQARQDTGRSRKFTVSDDTAATMTYLPDNGGTVVPETDPTLLSRIPGTNTLATLVKFSLQELEDAPSLEKFISDIAGLRVARAVEYALTLGKDNGTNTALPFSPAGGLLGNVPTGATTASLAAGIGYDDLVSLIGSVDHAYFAAPGSGFMASPSVFTYLLSQKDSTSRPYYQVDPETGLLQIAGKPLYINNAMPAYNAASSPVVLFGDFSRAYAYLNNGSFRMTILSERFIDTFEGAAVIYHRLGAATLVSGAVKALVTAAS